MIIKNKKCAILHTHFFSLNFLGFPGKSQQPLTRDPLKSVQNCTLFSGRPLPGLHPPILNPELSHQKGSHQLPFCFYKCHSREDTSMDG